MADVRRVQIVEVAPRDGLQNDPARLSTEQKAELVKRCMAAGLDRLEVASFVSPRAVPQMADAEAVLGLLAGHQGASLIGLVLNTRGFHRAQLTCVDEVNLVVVSSETFSQRNQGMSTSEALAVVAEVAPLALAAGITPTVTLAASFGCPYEGEVALQQTASLVEQCAATGVTEIALADTIGAAVPADVRRRVSAAQELLAGSTVTLRAHFHNTRNTGYANALAAVEAGVDVLDSSLGGIGGCPFAPKATGNIATEDLVHLLHRSGMETGVDLAALLDASAWLASVLERPVPSLVAAAGVFPRSAA
jgi:hydroxymethylglutaryl-CoA lyase